MFYQIRYLLLLLLLNIVIYIHYKILNLLMNAIQIQLFFIYNIFYL